ncbi:MAG: penicillin-binding transpeptidase domain-containing protein [Bdellovibrionaceae bacterium]|nr:penicillin-binding transpeptidase domain-containing protein [Pseudobdellovibrionaceae bacterium]
MNNLIKKLIRTKNWYCRFLGYLRCPLLFFFFIPIKGAFGSHEAYVTTIVQDGSSRLLLEQRKRLLENLGGYFKRNDFPHRLSESVFNDEGWGNLSIRYTLDSDLQERAERILKSYRPDIGVVVMMDALSGDILAMASYQREVGEPATTVLKKLSGPVNWVLDSILPAASLFKIVTASAAIEKAGFSERDIVTFSGGNYTLYRRNLLAPSSQMGMRRATLRDAFALSYNTPFGRLAIYNLQPEDLLEYSKKFGFNSKIVCELPFDMGETIIPLEKGFALAEISSGFNRITKISPIHAAMIAASIANDGKMILPNLVKDIFDSEGNRIYSRDTITLGEVVGFDAAQKLKSLMQATIERGTSRKAFRRIYHWFKLSGIEVGGKTGSITAEAPLGKVDWFVGFGLKNDTSQRIAIAAVTLHKDRWHVKPSDLAREMLSFYFYGNAHPRRYLIRKLVTRQ